MAQANRRLIITLFIPVYCRFNDRMPFDFLLPSEAYPASCQPSMKRKRFRLMVGAPHWTTRRPLVVARQRNKAMRSDAFYPEVRFWL